MLDSTQLAAGPSGSARRTPAATPRMAGIEQRILGVQVTADEIGASATGTVSDDRHGAHGGRSSSDRIGTASASSVPRPSGSRHRTGSTITSPLLAQWLIAALQRHPASTGRDDVEQDHARGAGCSSARDLAQRRRERPLFGELGPEEDRAVETELSRARPRSGTGASIPAGQRACPSPRHPSGVSARCVGVGVIGTPRPPQ